MEECSCTMARYCCVLQKRASHRSCACQIPHIPPWRFPDSRYPTVPPQSKSLDQQLFSTRRPALRTLLESRRETLHPQRGASSIPADNVCDAPFRSRRHDPPHLRDMPEPAYTHCQSLGIWTGCRPGTQTCLLLNTSFPLHALIRLHRPF